MHHIKARLLSFTCLDRLPRLASASAAPRLPMAFATRRERARKHAYAARQHLPNQIRPGSRMASTRADRGRTRQLR